MPVALQPGTVVDGGRVDLGRPEDSGLNGLARSLDVVVRSAADIAATAQENEFNQISSLLNDATAGPDEINEIAAAAYFPLNKFAAQNRRGEAIVAQAQTDIDIELESAKDPIEARAKLREAQQRLIESSGNDPGVAAGIRESIAAQAPRLLNAASARRQAAVELNKRRDESIIFDKSIGVSPEAFSASVGGAISDQALIDETQIPDIHVNAARSLLNRMIEDPTSIEAAKAAAYAVIEEHRLSATEKQQYEGVIAAAHAYEKAANDALTDTEQRATSFRAYGNAIVNWNPAQGPLPEDLLRGYRDNAPNPVAADTALMNYHDKLQGRSTGILGSKAATDGSARLNQSFTIWDEFEGKLVKASPALIAEAQNAYDMLMENTDPAILQGDGFELRKHIETAISTARNHATQTVKQRMPPEKLKDMKAGFDEIKAQAKQLAESGSPEKAIQLLRDAKALEREIEKNSFESETAELYNRAFESGMNIIDFRH